MSEGAIAHAPVDPGQARFRLVEEERALRASRPRNRRWRALEKLDREVDRLREEQSAAVAQLHAAEQTLVNAPAHDAQTLADWLASGRPGRRPEASVYERGRERDAARLLVEAKVVELDKALQRRVEHVERHRWKMLDDARRDVVEAQERLIEKLAELPALREELLASRETLLWIASFPEGLASWGHSTAVALGLREPVERVLGTKALIQHSALLEVLQEDVAGLANSFGPEQKAKLGIHEPRTPLEEAMWDNDPEHLAWKRQELEHARRLAETGADPDRLAAELRGSR
ncbi:MAG: hypothetical protein H0V79_07645 [Actinobacteria bacterium]|nr:hypothetical protein [Actinomycetota bacterium]